MRGLVCSLVLSLLVVGCDWGDKPSSSSSDVAQDTAPQPEDVGPADVALPPPDVSLVADVACSPGWEGPQCDQNINECVDPSLNTCDDNGACVDTPGSFLCVCKAGYEGDGFSCANVDECGDNALNDCDANAQCVDTIGSYDCTCLKGYFGNGQSCTNVDECGNVDLNDCHINATCTDTDGGYECACKPGYSGFGVSCTNLNECLISALNDCDAINTVCVDTEGSYDCVCAPGFSLWNGVCTNVDECADPLLEACGDNAFCTDTDGYYECTCNPGYGGDAWIECLDVNECQDASLNDCALDATCQNTVGSYECTCNPGFVGNGLTCTAPDACVKGIQVPELPYWHEGSTQGQPDDYQVLVPGDTFGYKVGEGTEDVLYVFMPVVSGPHTIRVRAFNWVTTAFYVITDCEDPNGSLVALVQKAMEDGWETTYHKKLTLQAGITYYLIIDGDPMFGTSPFDYRVEIGAGCAACPPGVCGTNACGKTCGCQAGQVCHEKICCEPSCAPNACGTDNGCGGTCKCKAGDYCYEGGVCGPSCDLKSCKPPNAYLNDCKESICDPVQGCIYQELPDGTSCPDHDDGECIVGKTCQQGQCVGGQPLECAGGWEWCSALSDVCVTDVKPTSSTTQDGDDDGYSPYTNDCMDNDPNIHPGAIEFCDGKNNDCKNGSDFDWVDCYTGPMGSLGVGECKPGHRQCSGGSLGSCQQEVTPVAEVCGDGLDNDCDGLVDVGCT